MLNQLVALFFALPAHAGIETHGGVAVACHDANGSVTHAELFDLWEGQQPWPKGHGLKITTSNDSVEKQTEVAWEKLNRINPYFADQVWTALSKVERDSTYLQQIANTDDVDEMSRPDHPACFIEQLGVYEIDGDRRTLLVNRPLFDALRSPTDEAAFFLHEAIYMVFRDSYRLHDYFDARTNGKVTTLGRTSRPTRQVVATLFSETELEPIETAIPSDAINCKSESFNFAVDLRAGVIHFRRLGAPVLSKTTVAMSKDPRLIAYRAPIESRLLLLERGARFTMVKTKNPLEYLAESTGGRLKVRTEKVRCKAELTVPQTQNRSLK